MALLEARQRKRWELSLEDIERIHRQVAALPPPTPEEIRRMAMILAPALRACGS